MSFYEIALMLISSACAVFLFFVIFGGLPVIWRVTAGAVTILYIVTTALHAAPLRPTTDTTKAPYKAEKNYCNESGKGKKVNIACYNHDACYSDPRGKSRLDCDNAFLSDMKKAGSPALGTVMYTVVRAGGWTSWNRSRENDKNKNQ